MVIESKDPLRALVPDMGGPLPALSVGCRVQTRSGGAVMTLEGWAETGEAICRLQRKHYHIPAALLRVAQPTPAEKPPVRAENPAPPGRK